MKAYTDPLKVVADIIQMQLNLKAGRVMVYNQQFNIPKDEHLFIVVREDDSTVFATSTTNKMNKEGEYEETNDALIRSTVSVDVMSANDEAKNRRFEVILALNSNYSQQMQELNTVRIAQLPTGFVNASELEASQMLNRFSISFNMMYKKQISHTVNYFDTFKTQVTGNK